MREQLIQYYQDCAEGLQPSFGSKKAPLNILKQPQERINAGMWRSLLSAELKRNDFDGAKAAVYVTLLHHSFSEPSKQWPWLKRNSAMRKQDYANWLDTLSELDVYAPVHADLLPGLGDWVCDIFNQIPRDLWSKSARLIAKLYRNSKVLYNAMADQDKVDSQDFFFAKIDKALRVIFKNDKASKIEGKTVREIFLPLPKGKKEERLALKAAADLKYGSHSHTHRHALYLLFSVAQYDPQLWWRNHIFIDGKWWAHFDKISDASCSSVLYTSVCDCRFFDGYSNPLDLSLLKSLVETPEERLSCEAILLQNQETPTLKALHPFFENKIRTKIIKSPISSKEKFNTQLVDVLADSLIRHPKAQGQGIYKDIRAWLCLDGVEGDDAWAKLNFDYMSLWLDDLQKWASGTVSILSNRFQELSALSNEKQRERILETLVMLLTPSIYHIKTSKDIKQAYFDLWVLLHRPDAFADSLKVDLFLENQRDSLIFAEYERELNGSFLEIIKGHLNDKNTGGFEYTKLILIVGLLMMSKHTKRHNGALKQLLRDSVLESLLQLNEKQGTDIFASNASARPLSPLAIWLLNQHQASQTPIINQIIQKFLMNCQSESERFFLMWSLVLQGPSAGVYGLIIKNLQFPYHLLQSKQAQYTNVDWLTLFKKLKGYAEKYKVPAVDVQEIIDHNQIWSDFLGRHQTDLQLKPSAAWPAESFQRLYETCEAMDECQRSQQMIDYSDLKAFKKQITSGFVDLQSILDAQIHTVNTQKLERLQIEVHALYDLMDNRRLKDTQEALDAFCQADYKSLFEHHSTVENHTVFDRLLDFVVRSFTRVLDTEALYAKRDNYIRQKSCSIQVLKEYFDAKYWTHTKERFEPMQVERITVDSWIESIVQANDTDQTVFVANFDGIDEIFSGYYYPKSIVNARLISLIASQPAASKHQFYPLLKAALERDVSAPQLTLKNRSSEEPADAEVHQPAHRPQTISKSEFENIISNSELTSEAQRSLRKMQVFDLLKSFKRSHKTTDWTYLQSNLTALFAAVISLTQLLDFGDSLLNLFAFDPFTSGILLTSTVAMYFGYIYRKQKEFGVPFFVSIQNSLPGFLVMIASSLGCALLWLASEGDFSIAQLVLSDLWTHFLLMAFLTSIIIAATKGAFDTE